MPPGILCCRVFKLQRNTWLYRLLFRGAQVLRLEPNLRWYRIFQRANLPLEGLVNDRLAGSRY